MWLRALALHPCDWKESTLYCGCQRCHLSWTPRSFLSIIEAEDLPFVLSHEPVWGLLRCSTGFCGLQFLTTSLLSKAGKRFTRKGKSKSKPHLLSQRQQSTVSGGQSTGREFICQLGHYAYQGRYRCSYDINFFQTTDESTHCLTRTMLHSLSNCCVDKNCTGNWLAPSQMPALAVINTPFWSQENAICKVNYFLTFNAPGILGNRVCNVSIPQFTHRLPPLPLRVRIKGRAVWHVNFLMRRKC